MSQPWETEAMKWKPLLNTKPGFNLGPGIGKLSGTPAGDTLTSRQKPESRPLGGSESTVRA